MKTICYYSVATHLGGAERCLVELLVELRSRKNQDINPWVLLPKDSGPLVDLLRKEGFQFEALPMPAMFFKMSREQPLLALSLAIASVPGVIFYLISLARILSKRRPALIHATGIKCQAVSALVGPILGIPVLWHLHDILSGGFTRTLLRVLRALCNATIVANSKASAEAFDQNGDKIHIAYNGVDTQLYPRKPNTRYRTELKANADSVVIGIVGVLARWKGQLQFLEMARKVIDSGRNARFVIVGAKIYDTSGDEDFEQLLKDRVRDLNLSRHVHFAGLEPVPANAMNGLDILVHASVRPEPFGRIVIEAMACGIPVVAAASGGVLEIIDNGVSGLTYEMGNVEAMTSKVMTLIDNKLKRQQIAQAGHDRFLKMFTSEQYANSVLAAYNSINS